MYTKTKDTSSTMIVILDRQFISINTLLLLHEEKDMKLIL